MGDKVLFSAQAEIIPGADAMSRQNRTLFSAQAEIIPFRVDRASTALLRSGGDNSEHVSGELSRATLLRSGGDNSQG